MWFFSPSAWTKRNASAAYCQRCKYETFHSFDLHSVSNIVRWKKAVYERTDFNVIFVLSFSSCHRMLQRSECLEDTNFQLPVWSSALMTSTSFLLPKTAPSLNVSIHWNSFYYFLIFFTSEKCAWKLRGKNWMDVDKCENDLVAEANGLIMAFSIQCFSYIFRGYWKWEETAHSTWWKERDRGSACWTYSPCPVYGHIIRWKILGE